MAEIEKRTLLLCFIHGFKGNNDTFQNFPQDLRTDLANRLPHQHVESIVYPKYETKGELDLATSAFLEWLKERVIAIRKTHYHKPWPPDDRKVGVVLVAHSMGGFVASDALFRVLDDNRASENQANPLFPLIHGILAFDTPYNGLARSMFVYGAFSNYNKVSSVFNIMTALSAAAPATLSKLVTRKGLSSAARSATKATTATTRRAAGPAWKAWQLIAVRTGTVGAIAAGGVAAYIHRKQIYEGVQSLRGLRMSDVSDNIAQGYRGSVDALGQGLAYVNRGQVGASFAWLADHFTFVGALLKPPEMARRLERLAALKGVGIRDFYASLGENGAWNGGYFVPERTFCAVPAEQTLPASMFSRYVIEDAEDEVQAHMSLFKPEKNKGYERMTRESSNIIVDWFNSDAEIFDDPSIAITPPAEEKENAAVDKAVEEVNKRRDDIEKPGEAESEMEVEVYAGEVTDIHEDDDALPDESPLDIAAIASFIPLPEDEPSEVSEPAAAESGDSKKLKDWQRKAYLQYLLGVAQQAGTNINSLRSYLPTKLPGLSVEQVTEALPKLSIPTVSLPSMQMPSISFGSQKEKSTKSSKSNSEMAPTNDIGYPTEVEEKKDSIEAVQEGPPSNESRP